MSPPLHLDALPLNRRTFLASAAAALGLTSTLLPAEPSPPPFQLKYLLSSCMYGTTPLAEIFPEVARTGATAIDIWPRVHGNQREQLQHMGEARFTELLAQHKISLGCLTQYPLGPFRLTEELRLAQRLNCGTIVTAAGGPRGLSGTELKSAIRAFLERMKPHLALAEACHVTIALENHSHDLFESPDALKWLVDLKTTSHLGIAFAPYHLPQETALLSDLLRQVGHAVAVFYAWQHGAGCMQKLPKEQELLQLPGRGNLDFTPVLQTLRELRYTGWTSIFMHPFPRGIPILDSTTAVTQEINRARSYLTRCLSPR